MWCGGGLVAKLSPTVCNPMGCSLQNSSVHGISQVRILEWVAIYIHFFEHIYWAGQKVHLDFSVRCYGKIIYIYVCVCVYSTYICVYVYIYICVHIHVYIYWMGQKVRSSFSVTSYRKIHKIRPCC